MAAVEAFWLSGLWTNKDGTVTGTTVSTGSVVGTNGNAPANIVAGGSATKLVLRNPLRLPPERIQHEHGTVAGRTRCTGHVAGQRGHSGTSAGTSGIVATTAYGIKGAAGATHGTTTPHGHAYGVLDLTGRRQLEDELLLAGAL